MRLTAICMCDIVFYNVRMSYSITPRRYIALDPCFSGGDPVY